MKKVGLIILYVVCLGLIVYGLGFLLLSFTSCDNNVVENPEIIFSGNLRTDYELSYALIGAPEGSGWRYTIEIIPIDKGYRYDKQPLTVSFLSDVKIENIVESPDVQHPEIKVITVPELGLRISWRDVVVDDNFGLYCPGKDLDEFIVIPGGEGELTSGRYKEICRDYDCHDLYSLWVNNDAYQFMGGVKYINHYKSGDIAMFYERGDGSGLIIDSPELFGKNCMIEIGEIESFLPLKLPFELNFKDFDYTTIGFVKELLENSDCLSSHKENSPHNNYISFYTENMACQLWYESGTTLESVTFKNALKNITF